jgi:hypothetical protein
MVRTLSTFSGLLVVGNFNGSEFNKPSDQQWS